MSNSVTTFVGLNRLLIVKRNLTLTNSYREDTGMYQCTASNNAGNDTRIFIVTVQCKYCVAARLVCVYMCVYAYMCTRTCVHVCVCACVIDFFLFHSIKFLQKLIP